MKTAPILVRNFTFIVDQIPKAIVTIMVIKLPITDLSYSMNNVHTGTSVLFIIIIYRKVCHHHHNHSQHHPPPNLHALLRRSPPLRSFVVELDNAVLFRLVRGLVAEEYLKRYFMQDQITI